jgi:hypothetical protein
MISPVIVLSLSCYRHLQYQELGRQAGRQAGTLSILEPPYNKTHYIHLFLLFSAWKECKKQNLNVPIYL